MVLTGASNESRFLFTLGQRTDIRVLSFQITEAISTNFTIDLTLACDRVVAFDDIVGQKAFLTVLGHQTDRYWHGLIRDFIFMEIKKRFFIYHATLVPALWMLTQEQDCRIFQDNNTQHIVEKILNEAGLTSKEYAFNNQSPGMTREYCVQYRETDFDFIARLLEEDGIFFFFNHDQKATTVVFGDGPSAYEPIDGDSKVTLSKAPGMVAEHEFVRSINFSRHVHSGKVTLRDYNFEKPALDLTAERKDKVFDNLEIYDYPGRYGDPSTGKNIATIRLQKSITYKDQCNGDSVCPRFAPGRTFTLKTTERLPEFTKEYLLVSVSHVGEQPQALEELADPNTVNSYHNTFKCIPSSVTFRPQGGAKKPTISGVQTAMVVGPANEEIFTDQYGRIKVQFHWDREGNKNDKSSCWIRVSQVFTGAGFGAMAVPRIGQEMIVGFIEGDPDRPIITGRVYHGNNPTPYTLPGEKSKTTFRSNSTPGGCGSNELTFEDKKGKEQIYLRAERDLNEFVKHDHVVEVCNNEIIGVGGNQVVTVRGNSIDEVIGTKTCMVQGNRMETVQGIQNSNFIGLRQENVEGVDNRFVLGTQTLLVKGSRSVWVNGSSSAQIGTTGDNCEAMVSVFGKSTIFSTERINIVSKDEIVLECGMTKVVIGPDAVSIKTNKISLHALDSIALKSDGPTLDLTDEVEIASKAVKIYAKGSSVELETDADINGGKVKLNCGAGQAKAASEKDEKSKTKQLKIQLHDYDMQPLANKKYRLMTCGNKYEGTTDGDGYLNETVPDEAEKGQLNVWLDEYPTGTRLNLILEMKEELPPATSIKGALFRLKNLGYYTAEVSDNLTNEGEAALRSFQDDNKLEVTGELDEKTKAKIAEIYGS